LREKEASKAPAEDSKGLSHFRAKFAGNSTSAFSTAPAAQEGAAAAASAPGPAHVPSDKVDSGPSLHPAASASSSVEASNPKAPFPERSSSFISTVPQIPSFEASDTVHGMVNSDSAPAAVRALKSTTEARVSAVEARAEHLRSQLDQMLALMEQKDKDIEGVMFMWPLL
jgi:hypothetical protein